MVDGGRELATSSDDQTRGLHNLGVGRKLLRICLLRLLLRWVEGCVERGIVEVFGAIDTLDVLECVADGGMQSTEGSEGAHFCEFRFCSILRGGLG